jgi:hypothetical protein
MKGNFFAISCYGMALLKITKASSALGVISAPEGVIIFIINRFISKSGSLLRNFFLHKPS